MSLALHEWIACVEADASLREPARLRERLEVLDRLELYGEGTDDPIMLARIDARRTALEALNRALYADMRQAIRAGRNAFAPWIDALEPLPGGDGYDFRDDLVSGVLDLDEPGDAEPLPRDMVFYQPTPARHVFDLIRRARLDAGDVVVDLGSGLGIVPMLIAIASGARAIGIERQAPYVEASRRCAQRLEVRRSSFRCIDARDADVASGTLFYLYTPFTGSVMRNVLDMLRCEAERRPLRVATFGPCTSVVAGEAWLHGDAPVSAERVALFRSR